MVKNIIKNQYGSGGGWRPRHHFLVCMLCYLDLGDISLGQNHVTPLDQKKQWKKYQDPTWEWPPRHHFLVCMLCDLDLDLKDTTLGCGHDTPLGHGQQLCKLLSRSNMAVEIYGPDINFWYGYFTQLLSMTHPLVMDNNCMKYPYPTMQWGVIARTQILGMCTLWPWP